MESRTSGDELALFLARTDVVHCRFGSGADRENELKI